MFHWAENLHASDSAATVIASSFQQSLLNNLETNKLDIFSVVEFDFI
jgi:hypothetical protein